MKFEGRVYCGDIPAGTVSSDTLAGLKRAASKKANSNFKAVDLLIVHHALGEDIEPVTFQRLNKLSPNNPIRRGRWA